jgi:Anti-sigma-K factor rskA
MPQYQHGMGSPSPPALSSARGFAPDALRRRVLASVNNEAEPRWRRLRPLGWLLIVLVICSLGLAFRPSAGGPDSVTQTVRASLRAVGHRGELDIAGLPEPPIGEVYELWLRRADRPPAPTDTLFTVSRAGNAAVDVPSDLDGLSEVLVTAEPLGGSPSPTSAPVLRMALRRA